MVSWSRRLLCCWAVGVVLVGCGCGDGDKPGAGGAKGGGSVLDGGYLTSDDQALLNDRTTRAATIRRLGQQKVRAAEALLLNMTQDPDVEVRIASIWALGEMANPDSLNSIARCVHDAKPKVRLAVAEALGKIRGPLAVRPLVEALTDDDQAVRAAAAKALGPIDETGAAEGLAQVIGAPDHEVPARLAIVAALARKTGEKAIEGLAKALLDPDAAVRLAAAKALAKMEEVPAAGALAKGLTDANREVRQTAAARIRQAGKAVLPDIEQALAAPGTLEARADTLKVLVDFGGPETVPSLIKLLERMDAKTLQAAGELKDAVVQTLAALGDAVVEPLNKEAISEPCQPLAKEAAAAVCARVGKAAVEPIVKSIVRWHLYPNQWELKLWVKTLGEIGDVRAQAAFNRAAAQEIPDMDQLIAEARAKIEAKSGSKLPPLEPEFGVEMGSPGSENLRPAKPMAELFRQAAPGKGGWPDDGIVKVVLQGGLLTRGTGDLQGRLRPLELELVRANGAWEKEVWGLARKFNQADHEGTLLSASDADPCVLKVEMMINDDQWVKGGWGEYEIELRRQGEDMTGSFRGRFNYQDVSGAARATIREMPPAAAKGKAFASGEHPRLLFRASEAPALRRRARTDFGRAVIRALQTKISAAESAADERGEPSLDLAIGYGLLYALFNDEPYGRRAVPTMHYMVKNPGGGHQHDTAYKLNSFAFVYDLTYHCLTPPEKEEFNNHLAAAGGIITQKLGLVGNFNNGPNSNWTAIGVGGAGLAALAVMREKGNFDLNAPREMPQAYDVPAQLKGDAPADAPVNDYRPGVLLKNWLFVGPLEDKDDDPLKPLGGVAAADPRQGSSVAYEGKTFTFQALPEAAAVASDAFGRKPGRLAVPGANTDSRCYLYSLLKVPQTVGAVLDCSFPLAHRGSRAYINGRKIENGTVLLLQPGLHRFLIEIHGQTSCPFFVPTDACFAVGQWERYQRQLQRFEAAKALYEKTGEWQLPTFKVAVARRNAARWWQNAIGDHAWKTEPEGYHGNSVGNLLPFTVGWETAFGEPLVEGTGLPWVLPLNLARGCASGGGGYSGEGPGVLASHHLCCAMHMVPRELQPAIVYQFNRAYLPDKLTNLGCKDLAFAFVNYPLDVKPAPPGEIMPKVIEDRRKGAYVFRNAYKDADDIVTHMFLRAERPAGPAYFHQQSGSFRISGLGAAWAVGIIGDKRDWQYTDENVVVVDPSPGSGLGKKIYFTSQPDGSGILGADMSGVHNAGTNLGVKAERHFAVDYSGRSGAPGLFVLLDRVTGGETKTWLMHTAGGGFNVSGQSFTVEQGEKAQSKATMQGLFVSPPQAKLAAEGGTLKVPVSQKSADYWVVMTIQKNAAPKISVTGAGLDAVVKVGEREVRFDGKQLVLK